MVASRFLKYVKATAASIARCVGDGVGRRWLSRRARTAAWAGARGCRGAARDSGRPRSTFASGHAGAAARPPLALPRAAPPSTAGPSPPSYVPLVGSSAPVKKEPTPKKVCEGWRVERVAGGRARRRGAWRPRAPAAAQGGRGARRLASQARPLINARAL